MPTSEKRSTDSLLERARRGCQSALNHLMASYRSGMLRHAEGRLARKQDASDMVQAAQLVAVTHFGGFEGQTLPEFRGWMMGILGNLIDHENRFWARKKRDRRRERALNATVGGRGEPAGCTTSILGQLVLKEECEQLMVAAGWCREEERVVISLHLFEGRSHEEIATEWNVSSDAVRQRFCRAVRCIRKAKRLQTLMTEYGMTGPQQDAVGMHRFRHLDAATIAKRLELPKWLVESWIDEARPLVHQLDEEKP